MAECFRWRDTPPAAKAAVGLTQLSARVELVPFPFLPGSGVLQRLPRKHKFAWCTALLPLLFLFAGLAVTAQTLAHRLILKDGSYQAITKYEIHGERVRYFSAERGEWEELPKALVDWDATDKYQQGLVTGAAAPEAVELDKELEAERKVAEARTPEVAPGLRLSDEGGVYLLDTFQNEVQLAEIQQSGSDVNRKLGTNILRAAINPLAGARMSVELPEGHAKVQSHTAVPSIYVNVTPEAAPEAKSAPATAQAGGQEAALAPADQFKIIRLETKGNKRVAGAVKASVTGKVSTDERFVAATVTPMTGGWMKVTPVAPLANGEYAVAEMLGKESMNLNVWDFGVNPSAPANAFVWKADPKEAQPKPNSPPESKQEELKKRDKEW